MMCPLCESELSCEGELLVMKESCNGIIYEDIEIAFKCSNPKCESYERRLFLLDPRTGKLA